MTCPALAIPRFRKPRSATLKRDDWLTITNALQAYKGDFIHKEVHDRINGIVDEVIRQISS